ncbi:MAG TPA: hypothetical protein VK489_02590 [Ferruginibacter sp.]|nr:hypothetical protein [Ferruginibacter sp.]
MTTVLSKIPVRAVIHIKDVENITGMKDSAARKLLQKIRKTFNKPKGAFVTIKDFCMHTGMSEEEVKEYLIG